MLGDPATQRGNGYAVSRDLAPRLIKVADLKPAGRETRKHPPQQVRKLATSLTRFGFVLPILIGPDARVVAGWALVLAARQLGLAEVPTVKIIDLSEADLRVLRLALNRLAEDSRWDGKELRLEFSEIVALAPHLELETSGFHVAEINRILEVGEPEQEDELPSTRVASAPVTRPGDLWLLGEHRVLCGDPSSAESYERLLGRERVTMVFADVSCAFTNTSLAGSAPRIESSSTECLTRIQTVFRHAAGCTTDGALHLVCTPWQVMKEAVIAGEQIYGALTDTCVWIVNPTSGRKGILYSPEFKLVFVFQAGSHDGNAQGRTRVWDRAKHKFEGTTKFLTRATNRPAAILAEMIGECSNQSDLILDPFGHLGATLIASARTSRRARLVERDPASVDISIERWQRMTGGTARHADTGREFACFLPEAGATAGGG